MSNKNLSVSIEGDFVDSYIYSGYLFLVGHDYRITIYKWEQILEVLLCGVDPFKKVLLFDLLKDTRKSIPSELDGTELTISKKKLDNNEIFSYEIGVWPSDLNIYSNNLYISSEDGVSSLKFNWDKGILENPYIIFDEMSFSVSPNSSNRLAIAAGKSGVLTYIPISKYDTDHALQQVIDKTCIDIDWQSTALIANTTDGVCRADYKAMPIKGDFEHVSDYYNSIKSTKSVEPDVKQLENYSSAWIAGDKVFHLSTDGRLSLSEIDEKVKNEYSKKQISETVIRARTGAFGTVIETEEKLYTLTSKEQIFHSHEPVNWRVFPRARNYANQLHIVKDDHLEINIIGSAIANEFGFSVETIDTKG